MPGTGRGRKHTLHTLHPLQTCLERAEAANKDAGRAARALLLLLVDAVVVGADETRGVEGRARVVVQHLRLNGGYTAVTRRVTWR